MNETVKSSDTRPVVSFCIPVYNNAAAAQKIVNGLLISDDPRFEVVVVDNASKDNVQEVLSQIHDPRFRFYRNDTNLGAHKNWQRALELGRGMYLFLSMVRDRLYGEKITNLIDILEHAHEENITLFEDGYDTKTDFKVYDGIDAMIRFLRICHPTATIFDGDIFRAIPDHSIYFENSDMYPENYVRRDCLLKGKGASIVSGVYSRKGDFYFWGKLHSMVEYAKPVLDMYYAPRRKTLQIFELIDMLEADIHGVFGCDDMNKYFAAKFNELLYGVSIGWYAAAAGGSEYYGQKPRKITMREMCSNIFDAYKNTKAHLQEKRIFTRAKQSIMYKCVMEALVKVFLYVSVKLSAKKILQPLGIWKLLQKIRHSL